MDFRIARFSLVPKRLVASAALAIALGAASVLAARSSTARAEQAADPVVARLNGVEIRESDVAAADREMGRNLTMHPEARRDEVIKYLIDTLIVSSAADQAALDEAQIRARVAFARNRVISEQVIADAGRKAVSEQAVRKAYDDMVAKISTDPEYHLYALQFPFPDPNDDATVKAAEEKVRAAYQRITNGEAFEAVARDMSDDRSTKSNGGNRGYLTRAMMGKEYAEVVPTLDKGKTSQPIKTRVGWHLIKIEETRLRTPPDLQVVRGQLEINLARQAQADLIKKLRSDAKIQRLDDASAGNRAAPPEE
jgi:peptidyl-prolyl cis-trans isomerase C